MAKPSKTPAAKMPMKPMAGKMAAKMSMGKMPMKPMMGKKSGRGR